MAHLFYIHVADSVKESSNHSMCRQMKISGSDLIILLQMFSIFIFSLVQEKRSASEGKDPLLTV